jgi:hypothetical protein
MRDDNSRTEADAARFAAIAGRDEDFGGGPGDQGVSPLDRVDDTRCVWCQGGEGDHWHRLCWAEAHDYFDDESEVC